MFVALRAAAGLQGRSIVAAKACTGATPPSGDVFLARPIVVPQATMRDTRPDDVRLRAPSGQPASPSFVIAHPRPSSSCAQRRTQKRASQRSNAPKAHVPGCCVSPSMTNGLLREQSRPGASLFVIPHHRPSSFCPPHSCHSVRPFLVILSEGQNPEASEASITTKQRAPKAARQAGNGPPTIATTIRLRSSASA